MTTPAQLEELAKVKTMRDVFDYCNKYGLHSVAQGMIELPPPALLRELVSEEVLRDTHEIHQYGARIGAKPYLDILPQFLNRRYGLNLPAGSVMSASGVSGAIVSTLLALRSQGKNRIALIEPFYTYHQKQVEAVYSAPPSYIPTNDDFTPNWENIESALEKGLDAIIITNPNNPSGKVWAKDDLLKLVSLVEKHDTLLIVDEIYCDMIWRGVHFTPILDPLSKNVVVCRGWSKSLAAQSWRIGYVITHPTLLTQILAAHDPVYIAVNWAQYALAKYLTTHYDDFEKHVEENSRVMQANWALLKKTIEEEIGWTAIEPEGTMYGLFKHSSATDLDAMKLALDYGIGVAAGNMFFGGNKPNTGLIRIHYGFSIEAAQKIANTIREKGQQIRSAKAQ